MEKKYPDAFADDELVQRCLVSYRLCISSAISCAYLEMGEPGGSRGSGSSSGRIACERERQRKGHFRNRIDSCPNVGLRIPRCCLRSCYATCSPDGSCEGAGVVVISHFWQTSLHPDPSGLMVLPPFTLCICTAMWGPDMKDSRDFIWRGTYIGTQLSEQGKRP